MVSTSQFFDFMDIWDFSGDFLFFILLNCWKSPYEIVPYDTYIIFEEHSGAMLFARKRSKNINSF